MTEVLSGVASACDSCDYPCQDEPMDESGSRRWQGKLVMAQGMVTYLGDGAVADSHRHDAIQIVIGLEHPVSVTRSSATSQVRSAVIGARQEHSVEASGKTAVIFVEPLGRIGSMLSSRGSDGASPDVWRIVSAIPVARIRDHVSLAEWSISVIEGITGMSWSESIASVNPVIRGLREYVDDSLESSPRLTEAAQRVGVSERHLRRIVAQGMGMPFRRYVLWRRLRIVALRVQEGADLTTSAIEAGFADSAHLSRVFRGMFGLAPSLVLPHLEIVEAHSSKEIWPIDSSERPGGSR